MRAGRTQGFVTRFAPAEHRSRALLFPAEVTMRASERSDFYGWMLEPRPSPGILADARGRKAETAAERDAREARRTTRPAPKARRRGPVGRGFDVDDELDATG